MPPQAYGNVAPGEKMVDADPASFSNVPRRNALDTIPDLRHNEGRLCPIRRLEASKCVA